MFAVCCVPSVVRRLLCVVCRVLYVFFVCSSLCVVCLLIEICCLMFVVCW